MELKDKLILVLLGLVVLMAGVGAVTVTWQRHVDRKLTVDLQNQLAAKDKTLEEQKGLYTKLTLQESNVQSVLDSQDKQIQELKEQLKSSGQQLLDATQTSLTWRHAYEGIAKSTQSTVVSPPTGPGSTGTGTSVSRARVDFDETFDYIGVTGYTLTNPPEAYLKLTQLRPLKLTVASAQDKTGAWHTYVTSSETNVQADIVVSAVNPYLEEPKWYEKLALRGDLGVGSTSAGAGVLFGLGATYEVGRFDVGPAAWLTVTDRVDKYLGVMVGYHPFQR
jgi:cell division protein FtsL